MNLWLNFSLIKEQTCFKIRSVKKVLLPPEIQHLKLFLERLSRKDFDAQVFSKFSVRVSFSFCSVLNVNKVMFSFRGPSAEGDCLKCYFNVLQMDSGPV